MVRKVARAPPFEASIVYDNRLPSDRCTLVYISLVIRIIIMYKIKQNIIIIILTYISGIKMIRQVQTEHSKTVVTLLGRFSVFKQQSTYDDKQITVH